MRIALVQMAVAEGDDSRNVRHAAELLSGAADAELYLLPELWTSGYAHDAWPRIADESTPAVVEWLTRWAAERNALVGGTLISRTEQGGLANRLWLVSAQGAVAHYDKGHLFAPLGEDVHLQAGRSRVRAQVQEWTAALSICFDLRFPEHYRRDAVDGADLFLVSSAWPEPRCAILQSLVRARAIENQAVLALCNRTGPDGRGHEYCGGSVVLAPDGSVLVDAGREEGVVVAEVNLAAVEGARQALPVLPLRAPGLDW
jgi:predicted amidohydrolase